ncbi:uncharacterized protein B0H64DRAFT_400212 [Chaetomium fimeti]|uniref:Uncharacterized protein n=1 Tax=Chaetomium fimeti TaxID=1854472 RepID=A0AAE0HD00_9PEZI|nr:hypothetical protein B0H64DRAFT_400212 [Chaetomium fimeti]
MELPGSKEPSATEPPSRPSGASGSQSPTLDSASMSPPFSPPRSPWVVRTPLGVGAPLTFGSIDETCNNGFMSGAAIHLHLSTSPPFSPPRSPWAIRSPLNLGSDDEVHGNDAISGGTTPHSEASATGAEFHWNWEDDGDMEAESDSDSGTITPRGPPGSMTPVYDPSASQISTYSLTNLPDDDALRIIPAAEVRAQAVAIPAVVVARRQGYPHRFNNYEELPLVNAHPLIEQPLTPDGPYVAGSPPGPARIITNELDRSTPEPVYHDPTKPIPPGSTNHPFSKAEFRGRDRTQPTGLEGGFEDMDV